jgi:hypothetical protein
MNIIKNMISNRELTYCLRELFNNNKIISYEEFEKNISRYLSSILKNINPTASFIVTSNIDYLGDFEINNIKINREVIKDIYNGNISRLYVIFYELSHFTTINKFTNSNIHGLDFNLVKEQFINYCYNLENKEKLGRFYKEYENKFYYDNYDNNTSEVNARIDGYLNMLNYLQSIGIKLDSEEEKKIITKAKQTIQIKSDKTRYYKGKKVDLSKLYTYYLRKYPSLLEKAIIREMNYAYVRGKKKY